MNIWNTTRAKAFCKILYTQLVFWQRIECIYNRGRPSCIVLQSIDSYIPSYDTIYKIISTRMCRLILDCTHVIIILAEESKGLK
jgi:hypothetical protein